MPRSIRWYGPAAVSAGWFRRLPRAAHRVCRTAHEGRHQTLSAQYTITTRDNCRVRLQQERNVWRQRLCGLRGQSPLSGTARSYIPPHCRAVRSISLYHSILRLGSWFLILGSWLLVPVSDHTKIVIFGETRKLGIRKQARKNKLRRKKPCKAKPPPRISRRRFATRCDLAQYLISSS